MEKRIRCFCCGDIICGYQEYRSHITQLHADQKGEAWIECPACGFPVRDMVAHFKVKHPKLDLPKLPQMRARKWKEWDPKARKMRSIRGEKTQWKEGFYPSKKNGGQKYHYRSSWELMVMECLDEFEEVVSWQTEPFPIPYQLNGVTKNYLPDFLIREKDGRTLLVEIKPKNQCDQDMNQAKWAAAQKYCQTRGWVFEVWTERYLANLSRRRKTIIENAKLKASNPGIQIL